MFKPAILAIIFLFIGSILIAQDNGYLTDGKEIMRAPAPWQSAQDRAAQQIENIQSTPKTRPDEKPHTAYAPLMSEPTQIAAKMQFPSRAEIIKDLTSIRQIAIEEHAVKTIAAIDVLIEKYQKTEAAK